MERKRAFSYSLLLVVLVLLCAAVVVRLLHLGAERPTKLSLGVLAMVGVSALKCVYDLFDKRLDAERRLLSVSGSGAVALFLLSFCVPALPALCLLALAAVTLATGLILACVAGRRLKAS